MTPRFSSYGCVHVALVQSVSLAIHMRPVNSDQAHHPEIRADLHLASGPLANTSRQKGQKRFGGKRGWSEEILPIQTPSPSPYSFTRTPCGKGQFLFCRGTQPLGIISQDREKSAIPPTSGKGSLSQKASPFSLWAPLPELKILFSGGIGRVVRHRNPFVDLGLCTGRTDSQGSTRRCLSVALLRRNL